MKNIFKKSSKKKKVRRTNSGEKNYDKIIE